MRTREETRVWGATWNARTMEEEIYFPKIFSRESSAKSATMSCTQAKLIQTPKMEVLILKVWSI